MLPSAVLRHQHWTLYGVDFNCASHPLAAILCVSFSSLLRRQVRNSPETNASHLSYENKNTDFLHQQRQISFHNGREDSGRLIIALQTVLLFGNQHGVWCFLWLPGVVEALCTLQLNEPVSWGPRSWLRENVKAFMLRHQEELVPYEIQMGACHRWLGSVFPTYHWEKFIARKPHVVSLEKQDGRKCILMLLPLQIQVVVNANKSQLLKRSVD